MVERGGNVYRQPVASWTTGNCVLTFKGLTCGNELYNRKMVIRPSKSLTCENDDGRTRTKCPPPADGELGNPIDSRLLLDDL